MDEKTYPKLWTLAQITALALLICTLLLAARSLTGGQGEIHGYIAGDNPVVIVRDQPVANAGLAMMIDRGQRVTLTEPEDGLPDGWIYIQHEDGVGWVRDDEVSLSPPE
jgi:hypothetical protein